MAVRVFDGVDDEVRFPITAATNLTGAFTLAAVVKLTGTPGWESVISNHDSGEVAKADMELGPSTPNTNISCAVNHLTRQSTLAVTVANGWLICVVTKAAGTTTSRAHRFIFGGSWAHGDTSGGPDGNAGTQTGGTIRLGEWEDTDDLTGKLAVCAEWSVALSDAEVEALSANLRTTDWLNHAVSPAWVVEPGQNTPVEDMVGSSDSSVINGTTIDTGDDPAGWVFGVTAAVGNRLRQFF